MMSQPIFDMHAIAAQDSAADGTSQGFLDKLLDGLRHLPDASEQELAIDLLDRAASYQGSQTSFAEDLRAAVGIEVDLALG